MGLPAIVVGIVAREAAKALARALARKLAREAAKKAAQEAAKRAAAEAAKKAAREAAKTGAKKAAQRVKAKPKGCVQGCSKAKPAPKPRKIPKTYKRPSGYRKGVRDKVWNSAKGKDGKVRDPKTGRVMKKSEKWDMGHKEGYEFRKHQQDAMKRGIDRKRFLDEHNNPKHYRPETPATNRGHTLESRAGKWKGSKGK